MRANRTGVWVLAAAVVAGSLLGGCAKTNVYMDEEAKVCTGVPFYTAHPVLIATKTDSCGRPLDYVVATVPDLSRPQYIQHRPGIGLSGFTLSCDKGMATGLTVPQPVDPLEKVVDTAAKATIALVGAAALKDELDSKKDK